MNYHFDTDLTALNPNSYCAASWRQEFLLKKNSMENRAFLWRDRFSMRSSYDDVTLQILMNDL